METVTVTQAKATLSRLLQRVVDGEVIAIGRQGKPEVVMRALVNDPTPRVLGGFEEGSWISNDFDEPMPELDALFEGGDVAEHDSEHNRE